MTHLIDRRLNDRGKSAVNRERFLRRYKTQIRKPVRRWSASASSRTWSSGGEVRVRKKDISEPTFNFGRGGDREHVLPGNREYVAGDHIPRPEGGGGGGGDASEGGDGDTQDEFVFSLSREEFMQIFFDDLELPRLARTEFGTAEHSRACARASPRRACRRTCRRAHDAQALARRIALAGALAREALELLEDIRGRDGGRQRRRGGAR